MEIGARKEPVVFWFVALVFSFWAHAEAALLTPNGVNYEVQALISIQMSLNDPHGVLNWDENSVDPCGWTMVACSKDNFVITRAIPSQGLPGTISPSIGNLTHLASVLLQDNNITGPIPLELGKLPKLQAIDLSDNLLTGEITSFLAQFKTLQYRMRDLHQSCGKELDSYSGCMYYHTNEFELCRKEQKEFEKVCPLG